MATSSKLDTGTSSMAPDAKQAEGAPKAVAAGQRKIPGNLPYLTASGTLKKALDRLVEASRPDKFNYDFLENVLKLKGGSARAILPILKRISFITSDGIPTELYGRFRTEGGRGPAALQALKAGFPEIFKRSEYAYSVDESKLRDIIVEITGLKSSDAVAQAIKGTFNVLKSYIPAGMDPTSIDDEVLSEEFQTPANFQVTPLSPQRPKGGGQIGLTYNINIVLPETSDLRVLNAIFRSLKENILQ